MALYTNESRDRVRDAVDFVELVGARTELRRAGPARYEALCPFHDERTPSFGIDPTQKVYHCFGCGASGDVFTFVQETEGVDFKEALELLAERYGVELQREQEDPREAERRQRRERLLGLLKRTAAFYERYLWESGEAARAREYLLGRGLSEEMLREFKVGYSPSAWDVVLNASRRNGFQNREVYDAGLAQRSKQSGQIYDRFRARIMFPLCDMRGRVLGFGARAMGEGRGPKYVNTSDNELYHKGRHVYGADLARAHAARAGRVIVCEGYTDVIALHQAGLRNAVGLMGTALTDEQVGELSRMAQTVLLALDADDAGQEAMLRAAAHAAKRKLELRVVPLPDGLDPAELIERDGAEAIAAAVERSAPFVRFRVERALASGDLSTPEGRDRTIDELRPVFAQLPPGAMRMELTSIAANGLALPQSVFEQALGGGGGAGRRAGGGDGRIFEGGSRGRADERAANGVRVVSSAATSGREDSERAFVALCIALPEEGAAALANVDVERDFSNELLRRAVRSLRDGDLREPMAGARRGAGPGDVGADVELERLLAELVVEAGRGEANAAMLDAQRLQLELARVDREIAHARGRRSGDVSELAKRKAIVKRDFDRAYARVLEETGERDV